MLRALYTLAIALFVLSPAAFAKTKTYIYAASSLTGTITKAARDFNAKTGLSVIPVFGASSTLARQIIQGAPANLFISANKLWMDKVSQHQLIVLGSRLDLTANQLILIAPKSSNIAVSLSDTKNLTSVLSGNRIAIADPNHVPAGLYAKKALQTLKIWPHIKDHLAMAANVRIALSYVERGEVPFGIVYKSDSVGRTNIKTIALFPVITHPPILYPMALIRTNSTETAKAFYQFLQSMQGRAILSQFGFTPLP